MSKTIGSEASSAAKSEKEHSSPRGDIYYACRGDGGEFRMVHGLTGSHLERHDLLETTAAGAWIDHVVSSAPSFEGAHMIFLSAGLENPQDLGKATTVPMGAKLFTVRSNNHHESSPRMVVQCRAPWIASTDELKQDPSEAKVPEDNDRLRFLADAAGRRADKNDPLEDLDAAVRADALELIGGNIALGRPILSEEDLVEAIVTGFPADVLVKLREAGYPYTVLDRVVAPRRTLMRRKSAQQRLTRAESDAAWRLAHILSMATRVFDGRKAALAWLGRTKGALRGRTPIELLETSVGTAYIERILRTLDWGDVA